MSKKSQAQKRRRKVRKNRRDLPTLTEKSRIDRGEELMPDPVFKSTTKITKVNDELGLVFGWLMICKIRNDETGELEKYYDTQGDHIPEDVMLESAADFMVNSRATKSMHEGEDNGTAVFAWPVTEDICKAYGMPAPEQTGLMFSAKPPEDVLAKFRSGEYTGFSIGGVHLTPPTYAD